MKTKKLVKKMTLKKDTVANLEIPAAKTVKAGVRRPATREECWTVFTCPFTECAPGCFD